MTKKSRGKKKTVVLTFAKMSTPTIHFWKIKKWMFKICSFNESPADVQCPPDDAKQCISLAKADICVQVFNTYMTDSVTIQSCFKERKKRIQQTYPLKLIMHS